MGFPVRLLDIRSSGGCFRLWYLLKTDAECLHCKHCGLHSSNKAKKKRKSNFPSFFSADWAIMNQIRFLESEMFIWNFHTFLTNV